MPVVKPPAARHTCEDRGDSLRIVIPGRKIWFKMAFMAVWLVGWVWGEIFGAVTVLSGSSGSALFALVWLVAWTAGGAFVSHVLLWHLAGSEIVEVGPGVFKIRRRILGIGRTKECLAELITDLRISPLQSDTSARPTLISGWNVFGGHLAFDYGARTFHFGSGIDKAESKQVLATIQQRFPQYRADSE